MFFKSNLLYDFVKVKGGGKNVCILLKCILIGEIILKNPHFDSVF